MDRLIRTSVCRISPLDGGTWAPEPRSRWESGDYVVVEVVRAGAGRIEIESGRMIEAMPGDLVVGALGVRHATLEMTGDWRAVGEDGRIDLLTGAGLLGRETSRAPFFSDPIAAVYRGHLSIGGYKATMERWLPRVEPAAWTTPTILVVGSSMSAGKTATGRIVVRLLKELGLKVLAAKLTGAARWRDVLTMGDAGADTIWDFVDAGLPSTVCEPALYRERIGTLLCRMADDRPDVAVIEAGASPLEPYNGETAVELLRDTLRYTILCASDPYAVRGILDAFDLPMDLIAGVATNTDAGIDLIGKLTGIPALRLLERPGAERLREHLVAALGLPR